MLGVAPHFIMLILMYIVTFFFMFNPLIQITLNLHVIKAPI